MSTAAPKWPQTQARHGFSDEQVNATIAGYNGFFDVMDRLLETQP